MRKILLLVFASLFVMVTVSSADSAISHDNFDILGPVMGDAGISPAAQIIKVRLAADGRTSSSTRVEIGDVLTWDRHLRNGITVEKASADSDFFPYKPGLFAGIAVTRMETEDTATVKGTGPAVGYMAVKGFALASGDTSECTIGQFIQINGATMIGSFQTTVEATSGDNGVLLWDSGADGALMPVILH